MSDTLPPRVLRARMQLMLAHPYLAAALARLPIVNGADFGWCRTMATDGYYIYVNPTFCETLTEVEIMGVLAHEVLHSVLGHIDRRGSRPRVLWNFAIDYATNLLLRQFGVQLPANALCDPRYANMTAEEIYTKLKELVGDICVCGFDLHLEPGDLEGQYERGKDYPSADERRRLRAMILDEMAREMQRRGQGSTPGELSRGVELATKVQVSWEALLARFMNGLRRSDYRMFPFSKKHLWRGIYLPSLGVPGPDHLLLAIDTSGSVSAKELGQFVAELDRLRSLTDCRLTLLHCDAAVQRIDEIPAGETTILPGGASGVRLAGGGGTDFRPVFKWVGEQNARGQPAPDAVIYCTDGWGTFPPVAPAYPLVWVVTRTSGASFPFGLVIRLRDSG
ncbi:MAG TPA: VWA-like domain-containing protein [Gemmataceae bacterium]|nr:VWA-like domain-containing protein [Gemmataceae bacterium]